MNTKYAGKIYFIPALSQAASYGHSIPEFILTFICDVTPSKKIAPLYISTANKTI